MWRVTTKACGRIAEVQVFVADQRAVDALFWSTVSLKPLPDRLVGPMGRGGRP